MSQLGHNRGPSMTKGLGWKRYAWRRARSQLLPKMPIEVVRLRVKRAQELGMDYKAYAGIRATTGRDVIALLFSENALRLLKDGRLPTERAAHLEKVLGTDCLAMVHAPLRPEDVTERNAVILRAAVAPTMHTSWRDTRERILALKGRTPADGVVVIGETWAEKDWCATARLAGFLPAEQYFGAPQSRVLPQL
ncbi:MAG: hypothetical protein ABJF50_06760 [Paracoccaceae bacterium]